MQLSHDAIVFRRTPTHLNFCLEIDEKSMTSTQQQEIRLFWSQLILESMLALPRPSSIQDTYTEVIDESLRCYKGNQQELNKIDGFSRTYTSDKAIYWYTLDGFLYRVLNGALRTQNIILIYKFRFILQDIYQQLDDQCKDQQQNHAHTKILFNIFSKKHNYDENNHLFSIKKSFRRIVHRISRSNDKTRRVGQLQTQYWQIGFHQLVLVDNTRSRDGSMFLWTGTAATIPRISRF